MCLFGMLGLDIFAWYGFPKAVPIARRIFKQTFLSSFTIHQKEC